jgi:hypothetical protein
MRKLPRLIMRVAALAIVAAILAGCTQPSGRWIDARQVSVVPRPWPKPVVLAPGAPPRILALWMNETAIEPGRDWTGRIVTSTNVASVEVRTESFSFTATRLRFGVFAFSQHVLDVIPQYKRAYTLRVIARNAAGVEDDWLVPIRLL